MKLEAHNRVPAQTDDWWESRRGVPTGSRAIDVWNRSRGYILEIIARRESGERAPETHSAPTDWGHENEPLAIAHYSMLRDVDVGDSFLICHPEKIDVFEGDEIPYWRGTPDGWAAGGGLVEVKCPYVPAVHLETIARGMPAMSHQMQMEAYLGMSGEPWCDFISFDPRAEPDLQIFIYRYKSNPTIQRELLEAVDYCWEHVKRGLPPEVELPDAMPELF